MSEQPLTATRHYPAGLYRAEQVRELDRITIEEKGIHGFELMSRAGQAAFDVLEYYWQTPGRILVYCGSGNNAGDGYIIASLARQAGYQVQVVQVGDPQRLRGDAARAYQKALDEQVAMRSFDAQKAPEADVIVDALLGTGLSGNVRGDYGVAIDQINQNPAPVLAVDIPSGLCANTGRILGKAVTARATVTFIGMKQGLLTHEAGDCCGDIWYADLQVPESVFEQLPADCLLVTSSDIARWLPRRARNTHKGQCGRVLVVGGDLGMGGAVAMAAEAAARVGAGLVTVITRPEHVSAILSRRPELMVNACHEGDDISQALEKASVVVAGPGIGRDRWGACLLEQILQSERPLVLDADGLNYLSDMAEQMPVLTSRNNWILTPHPGEAARLAGASSQDIQADRFDAVRQIQQKYNASVVLKGNGTLIASADQPMRLVATGNPGMATGGMGDVLSGVIGGLIAQGIPVSVAGALGAWLHGDAADRAATTMGERGLLATDLYPHLRVGVNP